MSHPNGLVATFDPTDLSSTSSTTASATSAVTTPDSAALLITYMSSLSLMSDSSAGAVPNCPWALRAGSAAHTRERESKKHSSPPRFVREHRPHFSTPSTATSTRRFFARPSSVPLLAIGLVSPAPLT